MKKIKLTLSVSQQIIVWLLAKELFGQEYKAEMALDWDDVCAEAKKQTVIIPAFLSYQNFLLDIDIKKKIEGLVMSSIVNTIQNFSYSSYLNELMRKNEITYCILKGTASAIYYPDKLSRQMGDIDFLVPENQFSKAIDVLEREGFIRYNSSHSLHEVFEKDSLQFEMHFKPFIIPDGVVGKRIEQYLNNIYDTAVLYDDGTFQFYIPDKFHHGLVMLMHVQRHLVAEGIGLRHLCDWAVFANSFKNNEFEKTFKERLGQIGMWNFACILSLTAVVSIGLPYQEWMGDDLSIASLIAQDIISSGNFGSKDFQRAYAGLMITDRGKGDFTHNCWHQLIKSLNNRIYSYWPLCYKIKIFLPIGWCAYIIRRFINVKKGTRNKMDLKKVVCDSANRKKMYSKLKIFEIEKGDKI